MASNWEPLSKDLIHKAEAKKVWNMLGVRMIIYGRKNCGWCDAARLLLKEKGVEYQYFDIMTFDNETRADIVRSSGMQTVPIIYNNMTLIGGYTELKEYYDRI